MKWKKNFSCIHMCIQIHFNGRLTSVAKKKTKNCFHEISCMPLRQTKFLGFKNSAALLFLFFFNLHRKRAHEAHVNWTFVPAEKFHSIRGERIVTSSFSALKNARSKRRTEKKRRRIIRATRTSCWILLWTLERCCGKALTSRLGLMTFRERAREWDEKRLYFTTNNWLFCWKI